MNENYLIIGRHVDLALQQKIVNHEYVDFARLLPRGKSTSLEGDNRMELVSRGGSTFFVPVPDRETTGVTNFQKWEQAFRIFSNIYSCAYPDRATELIQYNHVIYMASTMYIWDNVYTYDKKIRIHYSHFPQRSWAIILHQAWLMYLNEKLQNRDKFAFGGKGKKEICERYNWDKCPNGHSCKYDHRCKTCNKPGHGVHISRKQPNPYVMGQASNTQVNPGVATASPNAATPIKNQSNNNNNNPCNSRA